MDELPAVHIDQVIRSRRRSLSLQVTDDGKVIARIPLRASQDQLEQFVRQHQRWIVARQNEARRRRQLVVQRQYQPGEQLLYLGASYALRHVETSPDPVFFDPVGVFCLRASCHPHAATHFEDWYREAARIHFTERVAAFAHRYDFDVNQVKISNAKQRWGSCSEQGNLNFSWRLLMAPRAVVDYVIIHELAHLEELNHSPEFWRRVTIMQPNHPAQRRWLHENGQLLQL
jgi:hypothetical protein